MESGKTSSARLEQFLKNDIEKNQNISSNKKENETEEEDEGETTGEEGEEEKTKIRNEDKEKEEENEEQEETAGEEEEEEKVGNEDKIRKNETTEEEDEETTEEDDDEEDTTEEEDEEESVVENEDKEKEQETTEEEQEETADEEKETKVGYEDKLKKNETTEEEDDDDDDDEEKETSEEDEDKDKEKETTDEDDVDDDEDEENTKNNEEISENATKSGFKFTKVDKVYRKRKKFKLKLEALVGAVKESECLNSDFDKFNWLELSENKADTFPPFILYNDKYFEPIETFMESGISPNILKNLEQNGNFQNLSKVQKWAIPAIRQQSDVVIIGKPKSGKTLSYLLPLVDFILNESYTKNLPKDKGPVIVILASGCMMCTCISVMCKTLIGKLRRNGEDPKVHVVKADISCEKEASMSLMKNKCDILISTPHCLGRLLDKYKVTNLNRLACLVFDDVDKIYEPPFQRQIKLILRYGNKAMNRRCCQKIFCGERWTSNVESLVGTCTNSHTAIITTYIEASIYSRHTIKLHPLKKFQKPEFILQKTKYEMKHKKIVIFCNDRVGATSLHDYLKETQEDVFVAHADMNSDDIKKMEDTWGSVGNGALIVTDKVLKYMKVRDADILIHCDLPQRSPTNFYYRPIVLRHFLELKETYTSFWEKKANVHTLVVILLEKEDYLMITHVVDYAVRALKSPPPDFINLTEMMKSEAEARKKTKTICSKLMEFSICRSWVVCSERHALTEAFDSPHRSIPRRGAITFEILKVHSPSWMTVRLIGHIDFHGEGIDIGNSEVKDNLNKFLMGNRQLRPLWPLKIGSMCCVKKEGLYHRCIVSHIKEYVNRNDQRKELQVTVRFIDEGDFYAAKGSELLELPSQFLFEPPNTIQIRVAGIQPGDFDVEWSVECLSFIHRILPIKSRESKNMFCSARIHLAMKDTIIVNRFKIKKINTETDEVEVLMDYEENLKTLGMVVDNKHYLHFLLKLAKDGNIELARRLDFGIRNIVFVEPQWAAFNKELSRVFFLGLQSTGSIYFRMKKFDSLLRDLEDECHGIGCTYKKETELKEPQKIDIGMYCLALNKNKCWCRGRVEKEKEDKFLVFFLDQGEFIYVLPSHIIPISDALLLELPFQAIECSLLGMKNECSKPAVEKIKHFVGVNKDHLVVRTLTPNLKPYSKTPIHFRVNLLNATGFSMNKYIVGTGAVRMQKGEKEHLKNFRVATWELKKEEKEEMNNIVLGDTELDSEYKKPDIDTVEEDIDKDNMEGKEVQLVIEDIKEDIVKNVDKNKTKGKDVQLMKGNKKKNVVENKYRNKMKGKEVQLMKENCKKDLVEHLDKNNVHEKEVPSMEDETKNKLESINRRKMKWKEIQLMKKNRRKNKLLGIDNNKMTGKEVQGIKEIVEVIDRNKMKDKGVQVMNEDEKRDIVEDIDRNETKEKEVEVMKENEKKDIVEDINKDTMELKEEKNKETTQEKVLLNVELKDEVEEEKEKYIKELQNIHLEEKIKELIKNDEEQKRQVVDEQKVSGYGKMLECIIS